MKMLLDKVGLPDNKAIVARTGLLNKILRLK
jgi:hypothetical protein